MGRQTRLDAMLVCRDVGHSWEEEFGGFERRKKAPWGTRRILKCRGCGMERVELITTTGEVMSRHYDKPHDYHKVSVLSKTDARKARLRRMR